MTKILIVTGGSGGHVIPALTIFDHLKNNFDVRIATDERGTKFINKQDYEYNLIKVPNLFSNIWSLPFKLFKFIYVMFESYNYLKKNNISKIISTGGYMSFPFCFASLFLNCEIVLFEPNSVIGRSNKYMIKIAKKILCYDKNFIKSLGIDLYIQSLEGFLYPDTYVLLKTYNEKDIIKILTKRFMDIYNKEIYQMDSNMSILEIMSLASIIQGEAMIVVEMPIISSVYHNRLKRKMKLEADPTVLYFMNLEDLENFKKHSGTKKSTRIFKKYKKMKNPYNTYLNYGLPLGPINNPGLEAIKSAINPAQTEKKYYYFGNIFYA